LDPSGRIDRNPLVSTKPLGKTAWIQAVFGRIGVPQDTVPLAAPSDWQCLVLGNWLGRRQAFSLIVPAVHDDCIEIAGELVPITPENALKIKQAVLAWQKDSQRARAELAKAQAANASIISLKSRLDACLAEMSAILGGPREAGQDAALRGLLSYSLTKLKRLQRDLDRILA